METVFRKYLALFILSFCFISSLIQPIEVEAAPSIKPTTEFYVNDYSGILSSDVKQHILNINKKFESTKEKPQVVVVTVPTLEGIDIETYALEVFETFKIGNKDYDNGILLLLATNDRELRIEVGYGLEGAIPDSVAGRIMDASINELSSGNYSKALYDMFNQLVNRIQDEYAYPNYLSNAGITVAPLQAEYEINPVLAVVLAFVGLIVFTAICKFLGVSPFEVLYLISLASRSSSSSQYGGGSRSSGGGGRSGGGGASRKF